MLGTFAPATGAAHTATCTGRTIATWVDPAATRISAILDTLSTHHAADVLLWSLPHPRWEVVVHLIAAAYLTLIEPWWTVLRSLALTGGSFESWDEVGAAVTAATASWNAHSHPFTGGPAPMASTTSPSGDWLTSRYPVSLPDGPLSARRKHIPVSMIMTEVGTAQSRTRTRRIAPRFRGRRSHPSP